MREGHLEETLRRVLAQAVTTQLKDPHLGFVTIAEVRMNRDRSVASVFVTVLGDAVQQRESLHALRRAERYLRQQIADQLRLRTIPRLDFRYDDSLDRSFRIEQLLDELGVSGAAADTPAGAGPTSEPDPGAATEGEA
jgi:ribosome-binding factor A